MDVQQLLDQERNLRQLRLQENTFQEIRSQDNLRRQERERWRTAELERRASWVASSPGAVLSEAPGLRPFDNLIFRMGEESRRFQKFADDYSRSAIGNVLSQMVKVGETYRRLFDPAPALKSVLEPFKAAPAFDTLRYVTPLAEFQRQFNALREHPFSGFDDLRSKVTDTILGLSNIVHVATAFVENPRVPFPDNHVDFSLNDIVDFTGEAIDSSTESDLLKASGFLQRIEARISAAELKLSTPSVRDTVEFWLAVVGCLLGLVGICLQIAQNAAPRPANEKKPPALESPAPPTPQSANGDDGYAGPCP
jgi:hypothetical protein